LKGVIVIGIDPGTANTGFGVVRTSGERMVALDGGVIETDADLPVERRLARLHESLGELIRWHEPKAMALEDLFFGKNVASALSVGEARGVADRFVVRPAGGIGPVVMTVGREMNSRRSGRAKDREMRAQIETHGAGRLA